MEKTVNEILFKLRDFDDDVNVFFISDDDKIFQIEKKITDMKNVNIPKSKKEYSVFFKLKEVKSVLPAVKYQFYLHDGSLIYSCKTEEKKSKYESQLKGKKVKYTLKVIDI